MIGGNQKCTGAAPIFKKRDPKIRILGLKKMIVIEVALIRIMTDPSAWIKKYFSAASEE